MDISQNARSGHVRLVDGSKPGVRRRIIQLLVIDVNF